MSAQELAQQLKAKDTSLWPSGSEAAERLGWLDSPFVLEDKVAELEAWAATVTQKHVVLIGMGGSSLGPEVLRACTNNNRLFVLDTTDPATVLSAPTEDSYYLISSKSGSTLEIQTLLAYFWKATGEDPSRFAAITDPGTDLHNLAQERGFSKIFVNDPNIGGRYSVLSYFGIVPAALIGYDVAALLESARNVSVESAVEFGVEFATAAKAGQDKLTIVVPKEYESFGLWVEQLIAESTGKLGRGIVPIPTCDHEAGPDRYVVEVSPSSPTELGAEFYRWEIATAVAGHVLEIDPFDQPNVTESKENTKKVLSELPLVADETYNVDASATIAWLKGVVSDGDYVSIQAYLPYTNEKALGELRTRIRNALGGIPVTAGLGPRFLHSTGQLHKGGANNIVSVQVVPATISGNAEIPGYPYDFDTLIRSQAEGDLRSLISHGRRVARVVTDSLDGVQ